MSVERGPRVKPTEEKHAIALQRVSEYLERTPIQTPQFLAFVDQVKSLELGLNLGDALNGRDKRAIAEAADAYASMRKVIVAQMRQPQYYAGNTVNFGLLIGAYGGLGVFEDAERSKDPQVRSDLRGIVADFKDRAARVYGQKEMDVWFDWFRPHLGV